MFVDRVSDLVIMSFFFLFKFFCDLSFGIWYIGIIKLDRFIFQEMVCYF